MSVKIKGLRGKYQCYTMLVLFVSVGPPPYAQKYPSSVTLKGPGSVLLPAGAGLHPTAFPAHISPSSSAGAAAAAGRRVSVITLQDISFVQPGTPARDSPPAGRCIFIFIAYYFRKSSYETHRTSQKLYGGSKNFHEISFLLLKFDISP
jgi:hypothetical protein